MPARRRDATNGLIDRTANQRDLADQIHTVEVGEQVAVGDVTGRDEIADGDGTQRPVQLVVAGRCPPQQAVGTLGPVVHDVVRRRAGVHGHVAVLPQPPGPPRIRTVDLAGPPPPGPVEDLRGDRGQLSRVDLAHRPAADRTEQPLPVVRVQYVGGALGGGEYPNRP